MSMIYLHTKRQMPSATGSLVKIIKWKTIYICNKITVKWTQINYNN